MADGPFAPAGVERSEIVAEGPSRRDPRLDVFRGLALVTIYVNHVPGTVFESFTSRNFGFSDAAEGFVLMAGIAAGLAYGPDLTSERFWRGLRRAWARAWTLYSVHIVTTAMALGIAAFAARNGVPRMIEINNVRQFFDDQIGVLIGIPTLGHQLGYFNILPLYVTLLLAAPFLVRLGHLSPMGLLAGSVGLWFVAGLWRLNVPAYPNPGGWFFNPFAWQILFVTGLLTGLALRRGERLVPVRRGLVWACAGYLALSLAWVVVEPVRTLGRSGLHALFELGVPFHIVSFDKTFVAVPRLLHALALLYLVSALPSVRRAVAGAWAWPVALMGRQALPVFATGSVLCIAAQAILTASGGDPFVGALVIAGGLAAQLAMAWAFETVSAKGKAARVAQGA
jgi:hypothetical protein